MLTGPILFIFVALLTVLSLATAWRQWFNGRRVPDGARWRRALGLVSVLGSSLQILLFVLFEVVTMVAADADYRRREFPRWAAAGLCLFGLVSVAAILGKGRFRFPAVMAATGMTLIWLFLGMAM
jgi:hypothetical protein